MSDIRRNFKNINSCIPFTVNPKKNLSVSYITEFKFKLNL